MAKKSSSSGKKQKLNRSPSFNHPDDVSDSASDSHSIASTGDFHDDDLNEQEKTWQDLLLESIDDLTEKRGKGARRTTALHTINSLLTKHYCYEALSNYIDTATRNIFGCVLKSASDEESVESLRALCLLALTFGTTGVDDEMTEKIIRESLEIAQQYNNKTNEQLLVSPKVRRKALFTYTLWSLIDKTPEEFVPLKNVNKKASAAAAEASVEQTPALEALQSFWPRVPDADYKGDQDLLADSITCWSLLCTVVPGHLLDKYVVANAKVTLMKLVINDHSQFQVKRAAAEAMCLLVENTSFSSETSTLFDDALDEIRRLSTQTDRTTSKKEKSSQKSQFRDFLFTIEDGESPQLPLTINGVTLNFESWTRIIQFNFFKSVLKAGINTHFTYNDFVREVFDISRINFASDEARQGALSPSEKKFYMGKGSAYQREDTKQKNKLTRKFAQYLSVDE